MSTIKFSDTEATITKIEKRTFGTVVDLEWSGPDDHSIDDFDVSQLGQKYNGGMHATGGTLRSGWVILEGECAL
jgi:hypothetical protein